RCTAPTSSGCRPGCCGSSSVSPPTRCCCRTSASSRSGCRPTASPSGTPPPRRPWPPPSADLLPAHERPQRDRDAEHAPHDEHEQVAPARVEDVRGQPRAEQVRAGPGRQDVVRRLEPPRQLARREGDRGEEKDEEDEHLGDEL